MSDVSYLPFIQDMTWSYSRISSFDSCPYYFYLKYIGGEEDEPRFYAQYGSFMHRLLERFYRSEISKSEMLTEFLLNFSTEVRGDRPGGNIVQNYIQKGSEYLRSFEPFPYKMVDVEKRVEFEIAGYKFLGFIDYLGMDEDGDYVIIDNKSRDLSPRSKRKKPTVKDGELDSMLRQLYIYSSAIKQEFGKFPVKLCFNCFRTGVFIEEPFNIDAYNEAIKWAVDSIHSIEEEDEFYPDIEYFKCRFLCGVSGECIYRDEFYNNSRRR